MKNLNEMKARQKDFVGHLRGLTEKYVAGLEKEKIQTILLSGSVARGDYFPGKFGGYVDLIVMTKEPNFDANTVFGKDIEPEIPYHCVETFIDDEKIGFEIDIRPFVYVHKFETFDEPGKWSILESKILYDENDLFSKELSKIEFLKKKELKSYFEKTIFEIERLIGDYICDKWLRRAAYIQLHENLDKAIKLGICCLYYINGSYVAPDNRLSYYTYSFEKLPENYERMMKMLMKQNISSRRDFFRRKQLFESGFLNWLKAEKIKITAIQID